VFKRSSASDLVRAVERINHFVRALTHATEAAL